MKFNIREITMNNKTVLITDSGSLVEYTKAYKVIRSKELGKMILYFGRKDTSFLYSL
jgi:hypothetical protein